MELKAGRKSAVSNDNDLLRNKELFECNASDQSHRIIPQSIRSKLLIHRLVMGFRSEHAKVLRW